MPIESTRHAFAADMTQAVRLADLAGLSTAFNAVQVAEQGAWMLALETGTGHTWLCSVRQPHQAREFATLDALVRAVRQIWKQAEAKGHAILRVLV